MNFNRLSCSSQEQNCLTRIDHFFNRFHLKQCLTQANIKKVRGVTPLSLFGAIFLLPFIQKSFFRDLINPSSKAYHFGKDAVYEFLKNPHYNWRKLVSFFSISVIQSFFAPLTAYERERVLIVDHTTIERLRSKSVELLARVYDHMEHTYIRGFRLLTLGWSDGNSFIPLDWSLLSSNNASNRYQGILKKLDKRTCGYRWRLEAQMKSTHLLIAMVKRALTQIRADYILMDSWFSFPKIITELAEHIDVICRLKRMHRVRYRYKNKSLDLYELYRAIPKRRGKAIVKASVQVKSGQNEVKIIFIRADKKTDQWIAILSTDLTLPDSEIIRLYGKRWDIEVFFKMCKQHLRLNKEIQVRDFDGINAYTAIVLIRYIFLTVEQREAVDDRTIGELFYACCDEMADITFLDALHRILILAKNKLHDIHIFADDIISQIIQTIMDVALGDICCGLKANPES